MSEQIAPNQTPIAPPPVTPVSQPTTPVQPKTARLWLRGLLVVIVAIIIGSAAGAGGLLLWQNQTDHTTMTHTTMATPTPTLAASITPTPSASLLDHWAKFTPSQCDLIVPMPIEHPDKDGAFWSYQINDTQEVQPFTTRVSVSLEYGKATEVKDSISILCGAKKNGDTIQSIAKSYAARLPKDDSSPASTDQVIQKWGQTVLQSTSNYEGLAGEGVIKDYFVVTENYIYLISHLAANGKSQDIPNGVIDNLSFSTH